MARLATAAAAAFVVLAVVATTLLVRPLGVAGPPTPPPSQIAAGATPTASAYAPSRSFGPARPASWRVDPNAQIGPDSTSIPLLVTEIECAGGQSPEGRILDPLIEYRADAVVISISIYTDPGDCPSNPEYPLTVELSEPLGDRLLLGGRAEPTTSPTPTAQPTPLATATPNPVAVIRPIVGAPISGRAYHSAIWTGVEMIIWGGRAGPSEELAADGAAYDPQTNSWRVIGQGPLEARFAHTAVWTGREMLIWGGGENWEGDGLPFADGAAYDPSTDTWRSISPRPMGRFFHSAVWTGSEMIVWSGSDGLARGDRPTTPRDGAAYDPARDSWRDITSAPFDGLTGHSAVWAGEAMIIWGGGPAGPMRLATGAVYDPELNSWSAVVPEAPIEGRIAHSAVWTGQEMLVWGGTEGGPLPFANGAYYDPVTGTWRAMPDLDMHGRFGHSAVWTGAEMLIWGGRSSYDDPALTDGFAYQPLGGQPVTPSSPPSSDAWGYPVPQQWGYLAETDSGLSVHVRPDLDSPIQDTGVSTFYVLGEQMVDGQPWLRVEYWLHREEMVFGWLPAAAGSLSRLDLVCRDPSLGEMGVDPAHTGECYAGKTLEIGPVLIRRDDGRSVVRGEPAWLAERPRFALYNLRPPDDQASAGPPVALAGSPAGIAPLTAYVLPKIQVHLPPELAEIALPEGWVTVTAHVGDPRSADCRRDAAASGFSEETPFEQELWCRQQIVISAITPSEPPPSLRPDDGPSY